ncbi:hypothetical protein CN070_02740 [Sinorhizobium meliloti]|nr:hypothetical protein CN070_02740 [Sinorhizobium meliloti]
MLIENATGHRHDPARRSTRLHEYFIHRNLKRFGSCPTAFSIKPGQCSRRKGTDCDCRQTGYSPARMSAGPRIEAMRKNERTQLLDLRRDLLRKRSPDNTQKGRREEQ